MSQPFPGHSSAELLAFEQVEFTYPCGLAPSIAALSLQLPRGLRCGLIGENGCGKTTLFLLAHGLLQPQRGTIRWHGERRVGLVFQNPENQLVGTTVAEDLSYGLVNQGLEDGEIRRRIHAIAREFDLIDQLDQPVHMLSLGQKKQLSLADVMVLEPELLLLDEPTAFLSPGHCRDLRARLDRIHGGGTTIVVASHDLEFLNSWADWLLVMDRGRLVLQGTPPEVFRQRECLEAMNLGIPPTLELLQRDRDAAQQLAGKAKAFSELPRFGG
jgi:cobalt/nickel transport system ATP-binding protein